MQPLVWLGKALAALTDQGIVALAGFSVTVLLARWLPPGQFGAYALAYSLFLFLAVFHNSLLLEPMSVFGPSNYRTNLPAYFGKLLRLHFALTFLLSFLVAIGVVIFGRSHHDPSLASAAWGIGLGTPPILLFWLWRRAAYVKLRPELAVRGAAIYFSVILVLLLLFAHLHWLSPFTAFLAQASGAIAASTLLLLAIRPQLREREIGSHLSTILKEHWEYGRWMVAASLAYWLSGGAYYVLAGILLRMEDVAALSALQTVLAPASQFLAATTLLVLPWAAGRYTDGGGPALQATMRFSD